MKLGLLLRSELSPEFAKVLKRLHYPVEVMFCCVRWYGAYSLSLRNIEELMAERGIEVDHSTIARWVRKLIPLFAKAFQKRKALVGTSWRMDETYLQVKGGWKYYYRAVDKQNKTIDFLLTAKRDKKAALRFFQKAIGSSGLPEKVTMDKSGSNKAALEQIKKDQDCPIQIRQNKYLNNLIEQDHRFIKKRTRPMLGFKSFWSAVTILKGIELMHMLQKGQMKTPEKQTQGVTASAASQFYSLAF